MDAGWSYGGRGEEWDVEGGEGRGSSDMSDTYRRNRTLYERSRLHERGATPFPFRWTNCAHNPPLLALGCAKKSMIYLIYYDSTKKSSEDRTFQRYRELDRELDVAKRSCEPEDPNCTNSEIARLFLTSRHLALFTTRRPSFEVPRKHESPRHGFLKSSSST